ncbi:MAG: porphobilinogen synthase [Gemmatimonadota bacterium]|nr:porphobilinogen synthase [Gemmatimonadota bacterium]
MVRETSLSAEHLIAPIFITEGVAVTQPIASMPGVARISVDLVADVADELLALGVTSLILFGVPDPARKDATGSESHSENGAVQQAIRVLKSHVPQLVVITDVCLCEYTTHGHCGLLSEDRRILNDETLQAVTQVALSHAAAGADIVAPSGMMDGSVAAIRAALDSSGYTDVGIMAYAVKYSSAFYGPFREAAGGAPAFGDRRTHQIDPANAGVALREAALDVGEGADFLMVKPALAYLDIVSAVSRAHPGVPLVAYNVSGEYAMVKAASQAGWIDEKAVVLESLTSMRRAGASMIITYHARDAATWLRQ